MGQWRPIRDVYKRQLIGGGDSGPMALGMEESGQPTVHEFMHADEPCAAVVKSGDGFGALAKDRHIGGQGIDVLIEPGTGGYLSQGIVRKMCIRDSRNTHNKTTGKKMRFRERNLRAGKNRVQ